ncbi:flavin reductase family protein [Roseibium sp. MMSF_3544]|uniref:flavin reductase family protein n=1 Tax=unclassified Roseibium TaxID=2629323 RepID=UPI00273F3D32|nr:flavin reductase family protein [Roseibium sp. MMSF_3544]
MSKIDPRDLRDAFGRFMTGVTVVTALDAEDRPVGFTANSFSSVSLNPPLLLVCPGKFLSSYAVFSTCEKFAVSVLSEGQEDVANIFAGYKGDRFARVVHTCNAHGVPVIDGAIATFSCKTHQIVPAGDHSVLMGEVTDFFQREGRGIGYANGQFFSLGLERQTRDPGATKNVCGAVVETAEGVLLRPTPEGYKLPECVAPDRTSMRECLRTELQDLGVSADLGPVFSVFDDHAQETHFAYLLAKAGPVNGACALSHIPFADLAGLKFNSPATARMMQRFAEEVRTRNFNLYLGDSVSGETHRLNERA